MKKYEGIYIFNDKVVPTALDEAYGAVKSEITRLGGVVSAERPTGRRSFCRPMKKNQAGHCLELSFELDPASVSALTERYKLNPNLIRVMIVQAGKSVPAPKAETPA